MMGAFSRIFAEFAHTLAQALFDVLLWIIIFFSIFYYLATNQGFITLLIENCKRRSSIQGFAIRSLCNMIRNSDKSLVLRLAGENNLSEPIIAALSVEDQSLLASVLSSAMRLHNIIDAYDEDHAENFAQLFDG